MKNQSGQAVVEYILLLTVAVSMAFLLVTTLVKRNASDPESSGALIKKWYQIENAIGSDHPN